MTKRTKKYHKEDAFHLNVGVPLIVTVILVVVNLEFFAFKFLEPMFELAKIYLGVLCLLLIGKLTYIKLKKSKTLKLSLYEFGVMASLTVFLFLMLNFKVSKVVYETSFPVKQTYVDKIRNDEKLGKYAKAFEVSHHEYETYYGMNNQVHLKVGKSFLGYESIKYRKIK